MASLFISHSSNDNAVVSRLCAWLREQGFGSLFLDFDDKNGIEPGRVWEREIYSSLERADAVVFVGTESSVASRWCFAELAMARALGKLVIPLSVDRRGQHSLLADTQALDLTLSDKRAFAALERVLHTVDPSPERAFAWDSARSPYPGLASFEEPDAAVFFGRQREIDELLTCLRSSRQRYAGHILGVLGPSGSGKSSLVRAGVVSRLRLQRESWLTLGTLRPGEEPTRQLSRVLASALGDTAASGRTDAVQHQLVAEGPSALVRLVETLCDQRAPGAPDPAAVLIVDQAEELITRASPGACDQFLTLLKGATRSGDSLWVVMTLRSEFLHPLLEREGGPSLLDDQVLVGPLDRSALTQVIAGPAARAGVTFEPGLVERIVEDTTGGDALPLLAYTLFALFERADTHSRISATDYDNVGGVIGALRTRADREYERLGDRVIPTLLKLVSTGEREATRRRALRTEFTTDENAILDAFIEARLLTSMDVAGRPVVEVAHEALLRQWPPLVEAIDQHRRALDLTITEHLDKLIADYDRSARRSQHAHVATTAAITVAAAAIPVAIAAGAPSSPVSIVASLVVVLLGISQLFQFQQRWIADRSTCEELRNERLRFLSRSGPYESADRPQALILERVAAVVGPWPDSSSAPTPAESSAATSRGPGGSPGRAVE